MKILDEKDISVVIDRTCDVCNESIMTYVTGNKYEECGELHAEWVDGANDQDGNTYHLDLCQNCFNVALLALIDHRRAITMFDKEHDLPDENFGLDLSNSVSS